MAVINTDVLEEYKAQVPNIQQQITYVLNLFPSELPVFVRPEIQSLDDLKGKKVNFNTLGTAAAYSGPLIFTRLGLDVNKTFIPHPVALEQMKSGGHVRRRLHHLEAGRRLSQRPVGRRVQIPAGRIPTAGSRTTICRRGWSRRTIRA